MAAPLFPPNSGIPAPSAPPQARPPKPEGLLGMVLAASVVVLLPFVYVAFLGVTGWGLLTLTDAAIEEYTVHDGKAWWAIARLVAVGCGGIFWLMMFKPLLTRRARRPASMELRAASSGDLFQLIASICRITGAPVPAEVRVDCSMGARTYLKHGLLSLLTQRTTLTFGLPLAAACSSKEFAGVLANQLGRQQRGLYGRLAHLVQIMNDWLGWVAMRIDPWEDAMAAASGETKKKISIWKKVGRALVWTSQRPIWAIMWIGRLVSRGALRKAVYNGDRCEAAFVGSTAMTESLQRQPHLQAAWEHGCASVQSGLTSARLPDSFPQVVARHAASVQATADSVKTWEIGNMFCPSASLRANRVMKLALPGGFALQGIGASFVRDFNDIARQATQVHYQHDLRLDITQFRLVSADEAVNQKRKQEDALGSVRRYFQGLCHPERGMCGESSSNAIKPEAASYRVAIAEGRDWMRRRGDQMRATLREWQISWQRVRDLEMAHAYALAGLPVDSHQYGVRSHSPELYREEIVSQEMIVEVSEDPLLADEARLETRFAAALALLWETPASQMPDAMAQVRAAVPDRACLYHVLASRLKSLRALITFTSAFESLGTKFGGGQQDGSPLPALKFLVPRLMTHAQEVLRGLETVECPSDVPGGGANHLAAYLLGDVSSHASAMLAFDWSCGTHQGITAADATCAGEMIAPLMDRFIQLYHSTFAFLASAAELSEMHLAPEEEATEAAEQNFAPGFRMRTPAEAPAGVPAMA